MTTGVIISRRTGRQKKEQSLMLCGKRGGKQKSSHRALFPKFLILLVLGNRHDMMLVEVDP